jgi:hypothetical protein
VYWATFEQHDAIMEAGLKRKVVLSSPFSSLQQILLGLWMKQVFTTLDMRSFKSITEENLPLKLP